VFVAPLIAAPLIAVNLCFSTESIGLVWDSISAKNQSTINEVSRLNVDLNNALKQLDGLTASSEADSKHLIEELEDTRAQLKNLPPYKPTTEVQIIAAQKVVDDAKHAQDSECSQLIGFACRKLQANLDTKQNILNQLRADRATEVNGDKLTARIEKLNAQIAAIGPTLQERTKDLNAKIESLNAQLKEIGTPPKVANPMAHRLADATGLTESQVDEKLPTFISVVAEVFAFLGPFLLAG
jgi:aspartate carbamoyltransferase regulatory subunit